MKPHLTDVNIPGTNTIHIKTIDQPFLDSPFHFHNLCELVWVEKSFGKRIVGDHLGEFEDGYLILNGPNLAQVWQNDGAFMHKQKRYPEGNIVYAISF